MAWLYLHSVEAIVFGLVGLRMPHLARLPDGRQPTLDAPPLGVTLALGARPVHDLLFFIHPDDHMADHLVDDFEPAIQLLHQLARAIDDLEHIHAFLLMRDLVGESPAPPVDRKSVV